MSRVFRQNVFLSYILESRYHLLTEGQSHGMLFVGLVPSTKYSELRLLSLEGIIH